MAEAAKDKHQGHQRPGNVLLPAGHGALKKLLQAQLLDELQSQPRAAEIATVLDAHAFDIDFHPRGSNVVEESLLPRPALAFCRSLHTLAIRLVELPEIGHD